MGIWGKMFGGIAGFAVGGPIGALMGLGLGHAADNGRLLEGPAGGWGERWRSQGTPDPHGAAFLGAAKMAALLGKTDQLFAIGLVVLSAKLSKSDGPVNRTEIACFKQLFQFPPDNVREIGMLFDQARLRVDDFEMYARELGRAFRHDPSPLENLITALFTIARSDVRPDRGLDPAEIRFLRRTHQLFGLPPGSWDRFYEGRPPPATHAAEAYRILGLPPSASDAEVKSRWRALIRQHHPDIARQKPLSDAGRREADDRMAQINGAWDRIKRDRKL